MKKEIYLWLVWLLFVILWNYGFPNAKPIFDVIIAIFLSVIFIILKKKLY